MTERGTPGCVLKVGFHFAVYTGIRLSVWVLAEERSANAPGSPLDTNASWESPSSALGFVGFFRVLAFRDHHSSLRMCSERLGGLQVRSRTPFGIPRRRLFICVHSRGRCCILVSFRYALSRFHAS